MSNNVVLVSGSISGLGALAARELADHGEVTYAGVSDIAGGNRDRAEALRSYAEREKVELRPIELDLLSADSVEEAVATIIAEVGRIDVLIHGACPEVSGQAEGLTPEQVDDLYDAHVLGAQRLNRAVIPHFRQQGGGLLMWLFTGTVDGQTTRSRCPETATRAAMDALAGRYVDQLSHDGIETSIIVTSPVERGTRLMPNDARQEHEDVAAGQAASAVSAEIARVVRLPAGRRPYRVHLDLAGRRPL